MKKRMLIMIVALVIIFGGIFGFDAFRSMMITKYLSKFVPPPVATSSAIVESKVWHNTLSAIGTIYSYQSVDITPQQAGQIDAIYFKSGDFVTQGQQLIGENTQLDKQTLASNQAALALAQANYARYKKLAKRNFVALSTLDESLSTLKQTQADLAKTEETIAEKMIKAPFAGKIGIREVNLGQYVSPGDKLTSLQSLNPLRVIFSIPGLELPDIKVGLPVQIKVAAYNNKVFTGNITAIDSQISISTRNIQIEAEIPNPNTELYPGMFANILIQLPAEQAALVVPQTAVTYNLYGDTVYVLTPEKEQATSKSVATNKTTTQQQPVYVAQLRYVTVGDQQGNEAVITKGLTAGELVATSGQLKLSNGIRVILNNSINPGIAPQIINPME